MIALSASRRGLSCSCRAECKKSLGFRQALAASDGMAVDALFAEYHHAIAGPAKHKKAAQPPPSSLAPVVAVSVSAAHFHLLLFERWHSLSSACRPSPRLPDHRADSAEAAPGLSACATRAGPSVLCLSHGDFVLDSPLSHSFMLRAALALHAAPCFLRNTYTGFCRPRDLRLGPDALSIMRLPNAGGNSVLSEALSMELLAGAFGARARWRSTTSRAAASALTSRSAGRSRPRWCVCSPGQRREREREQEREHNPICEHPSVSPSSSQ